MLQVIVDVLLLWCALWLAFIVRLGDFKAVDPLGHHAWIFVIVPLISVPIFIRMGMYRAVMRFFGNDALKSIFKAISLSALFLALTIYWYRDAPAPIPRSMVLNFWWLSLTLIGGVRLLMRQYFMGNWYSAEHLSLIHI